MSADCPYCASASEPDHAAVATLLAAIAADDLDAAIDLGLLQFELQPGVPCADCGPAIARLVAARDARRSAFAARERHRRRDARLAQRIEANAARRKAGTAAIADMPKPGLPDAAAAALARAKARAAHRT